MKVLLEKAKELVNDGFVLPQNKYRNKYRRLLEEIVKKYDEINDLEDEVVYRYGVGGRGGEKGPLVVGTLDPDTASKIDKMFSDIASSQDPIPDPKPQIGIMPEHLWKEERFRELKEVIRHYLDAGFPLPKDWNTWTTEYNKLLNTIKHEQ